MDGKNPDSHGGAYNLDILLLKKSRIKRALLMLRPYRVGSDLGFCQKSSEDFKGFHLRSYQKSHSLHDSIESRIALLTILLSRGNKAGYTSANNSTTQ